MSRVGWLKVRRALPRADRARVRLPRASTLTSSCLIRNSSLSPTKNISTTVTMFHLTWAKSFAASSRQPTCAEAAFLTAQNSLGTRAGANCGHSRGMGSSNRHLKILRFPTECCQQGHFSSSTIQALQPWNHQGVLPSRDRPFSLSFEQRRSSGLQEHHIVGSSVPRKEGWDKVTGAARYVDDMILPGMLHGATVRSNIPRGKIRKISFDPGINWDEFVVVTAKDIPGKNCIALILDDQPCLAAETVNHPEEPILLLAHPDRHKLRRAVDAVSIEYDVLPPVFSIEESEQLSNIIWGADNTFKKYLIEKGDVDAVWRDAAHIIEGEYFTGAQEQLYIENNGVIAAFEPESGVTVWGSLQCPYYVHKALMALCGLPEDKVRVVQMETGGAFGGKEEYPSMIAGHAALLAIKSGKPVKIIYDRMED